MPVDEDLAGADLTGVDLAGADLAGADLASNPGVDVLFPAGYTFNKDVSGLQPATQSTDIINALVALGGWGAGNNFDITFDFDVFQADGSTPTAVLDFTEWPDESDVRPFPVVPGGALEGQSGYTCPNWADPNLSPDCHYIAILGRRLYEVYHSEQISPGHWRASSIAVWNLDHVYGNAQRGFGCTSADAAGFPITAGLIRVNEVVTDQEIKHALRFILPNPRMLRNALVAPAAHYGGPSSTNPNAPPYGVRFRLKSTFDENRVTSAGGKVVVRALKKYGMLLADGGQIALTAERDDHTTVKWGNVLGARDLRPIAVTDFEVVDFAGAMTYTNRPDCTINNPL
jgi:serine/threonine-protein kinase